MGLTLLEAAKASRDPLSRGVISELAAGELSAVIPFENVQGPGVSYLTEGELPGVGFRGINEGFGRSYGVINPQFEPLKMFGGDLDVDKFIVRTQGVEARATQINAQVRAARINIEDAFLNGGGDDPREVTGMRKRVVKGTSQYFDNGNAALSLANLDELVSQVDSQGLQKYLIMSRRMRNRLVQASRNTTVTGFVPQQLNEQGRPVSAFSDAIILTTDVNGQNELIQPFTEGSEVVSTVSNVALTSNVATLTIGSGHGILVGDTVKVEGVTNSSNLFNGTYKVTAKDATTISYALTNANVTSASATGTGRVSVVTGAVGSIYCVAFGPRLTSGFQTAPPEVADLGEVQDAPVFRARMEWYLGFAVYSGRSVARLAGITDAAVVA